MQIIILVNIFLEDDTQVWERSNRITKQYLETLYILCYVRTCV